MVTQFQRHFFAVVVLKQCKYVTFEFDLFGYIVLVIKCTKK